MLYSSICARSSCNSLGWLFSSFCYDYPVSSGTQNSVQKDRCSLTSYEAVCNERHQEERWRIVKGDWIHIAIKFSRNASRVLMVLQTVWGHDHWLRNQSTYYFLFLMLFLIVIPSRRSRAVLMLCQVLCCCIVITMTLVCNVLTCWQGAKLQTRVGLLMLLCHWLASCPIAVTHFLHCSSNIPFVSFVSDQIYLCTWYFARHSFSLMLCCVLATRAVTTFTSVN